MDISEENVRFIPNYTVGWPDVSEIVIHPDRVEFKTSGVWKISTFEDLAQWPRPRWLWNLLRRFGKRPAFLPVAERDWFQAEGEKYFTFYTEPPLTIYLPAEEGMGYRQSLFGRVKVLIQRGGYDSWDLG